MIEQTCTYAISRCGICLRATSGLRGTGAWATSWIEEGRIKLIKLEVDRTGAVMAMVLPPEPLVITGAVMAIAWFFSFAGFPNTLLAMS
jgi:hypothetical protein